MPIEIRCLVCGGRGGWWSDIDARLDVRETCSRCRGTGWEQDPPDWLVALVGDQQDHDGFTPQET